jgi:hypothetical protein
MKKIILPIAIAACALAAQFAPAAPPPDVKEIMSKPLTDIPGKEGLVLTVTYPPGGADEIHRHDAHAFVYVLEGFDRDAAARRRARHAQTRRRIL